MMRDIRSDLKERLQLTISERQDLEAQLRLKVATEDGIRELLKQEEQRFAVMVEPLFPSSETAGGELRKILLQIFSRERRPLWLDDIKVEVAKTGYDFGEKAPGRAIHFALIGLVQTGDVERLDDKSWRATVKHNFTAPESAPAVTQ